MSLFVLVQSDHIVDRSWQVDIATARTYFDALYPDMDAATNTVAIADADVYKLDDPNTLTGVSGTVVSFSARPTVAVAAIHVLPFRGHLSHSGGIPADTSAFGNDTTPSVTETYIAEVYIPEGSTLTGIAVMNGSAVAGNMIVGLADASGVLVAQSASTAQSGTDAYQRIPFSAPYLPTAAGTYYILVQFNNTGARFNTHQFGDFGASKKTGETFGVFTTITPPTTFTANLGPVASLF